MSFIQWATLWHWWRCHVFSFSTEYGVGGNQFQKGEEGSAGTNWGNEMRTSCVCVSAHVLRSEVLTRNLGREEREGFTIIITSNNIIKSTWYSCFHSHQIIITIWLTSFRGLRIRRMQRRIFRFCGFHNNSSFQIILVSLVFNPFFSLNFEYCEWVPWNVSTLRIVYNVKYSRILVVLYKILNPGKVSFS